MGTLSPPFGPAPSSARAIRNPASTSASAVAGGDLSVTTAAAIVGTYGMQALLDDNNSLYVNDWKPFEETR